jgi:hypothetical protein
MLDRGLRGMGMRRRQAMVMGRLQQVVMLRVRRQGQGMGTRRRASTHKVPGRMVVCMLYKTNFRTCRLEVHRLRCREQKIHGWMEGCRFINIGDPKLLFRFCDMRMILDCSSVD